MNDYGEFVGIEDVVLAPLVSDAAGGYVAGAVEQFAPAASIIYDSQPNSKSTYYNNLRKRVYYGEGDSTVALVVPGLAVKDAARVTGKTYDAASGRMLDGKDPNPPYFALGYRVNVGTNHYRYVWFLKGTFQVGNEEHTTRTAGAVEEKTTQVTFAPLVTDYQWDVGTETKGLSRVVGDTTDPAFDATGFLEQVQTPDSVGAPTALALSSSVPADAATGVSKTANLTATFNNAMDIARTKFTLVTAAGAAVELTVTWNTALKVSTLAHAALAGTTMHLLVYTAVDVYGQELSGVIDFTTVA